MNDQPHLTTGAEAMLANFADAGMPAIFGVPGGGSSLDLIAAAIEMSQAGVATQVEAALVNQGIIDISGQFVVVGVLVAGVLLIAIAFVRVMVAVYLARGRHWARIVVAIYAATIGLSLEVR